jgi:site-specific recombinase XerD
MIPKRISGLTVANTTEAEMMQEPSNTTSTASPVKQSGGPALDLELLKGSYNEQSYAKNLAENPAAIYLASLKPTGRRSMLIVLNVMAGLLSNGQHNAFTFAWQELRYQHTAAIRTALQERYKPATANKAISALRRVLKEAWRLGLMGAEDYGRATDIKAIKGQRLPRGRALKGGELTALLNVCGRDNSPLGFRDAALIAVLYASGLRRSEVVKLDLKDYDEESGALTILGGKGGKDRIAYLGTGSEILDGWLQLRGRVAGPLFLPIRRGGHIKPQRLNEQSVLDILKKRGDEAGLKSFSPHDLRRTFISDLLDAEADIATVQKLAGHADVQTTARYDRRGEATKKQAAGKLHLSYNRGNTTSSSSS